MELCLKEVFPDDKYQDLYLCAEDQYCLCGFSSPVPRVCLEPEDAIYYCEEYLVIHKFSYIFYNQTIYFLNN